MPSDPFFKSFRRGVHLANSNHVEKPALDDRGNLNFWQNIIFAAVSCQKKIGKASSYSPCRSKIFRHLKFDRRKPMNSIGGLSSESCGKHSVFDFLHHFKPKLRWKPVNISWHAMLSLVLWVSIYKKSERNQQTWAMTKCQKNPTFSAKQFLKYPRNLRVQFFVHRSVISWKPNHLFYCHNMP